MKGFVGLLLWCFIVVGVRCQENAIKNLSPSLLECYDGDLYERWNLLPHNMETLIAIIRKIENSPALNMDLRVLSAAILHRFRQDGIVKNPKVKAQAGITPYAPLGLQFFRHAQTLRVIPGNAVNFPNNSISALERCTLHSMLSSSIDKFERGDESRTCKAANYAYPRRFGRSVELPEGRGVKEEVEMLTPEQLEMMTKGDIGVDPNSQYPALPPNHPSSARLTNLPPRSRCPIENGVVKTTWGSVSGGSVIAGIAAGLEPQQIRLGDLIRQQVEQRVLSYPSEASLDNKFLGTLAGDLAEVALVQGPQQTDRYSVGADGTWNSTSLPLYYFLGSNENLEMTAAEIRGDLDGLVLADRLPGYYNKVSSLRLSQVLDMYYNKRGLFERDLRACNRRTHLLKVAPTETLISQTHSSAIVLSTGIATATFSSEAIEKFATQAVKDLSVFIPTMNSDASCEITDNLLEAFTEPAVDLTILLDTTWPFETVKPILAQLLSGLDISKFNSNFTLMSAYDGALMINSSNNILDFYAFNLSNYENFTRGFDLPRSVEKLRFVQTTKLNEEQRLGWAGGKSDVVLIVPYQSNISPTDKDYLYETLKTMREEVPDAATLFLTYGSKDRWSDLVVDSNTDIFSISISETSESYPFINSLQSRIKQVPRRLINSQCGAKYEAVGSTRSLTDYVVPSGVNYYRIHPNYFSSDNTDNPPKIKIQGTGVSSLRVCTSRELQQVNVSSSSTSASCTSITSNSHTVTMDCEGTSYLHECKPFYLSVSSNSSSAATSFSCTDPRVCRYPDNIKLTISYENLVCKSGAGAMLATPLLLLLLTVRLL